MKRISDLNIGQVIASSSMQSPVSEVQKEVIKKDIEHIKQYSNIPRRYANAEFKAATQEQEKLILSLKQNFNGKNFEDIRDMLIIGTVGTGKTHLTIAMLLKLIDASIYCRYTTEHNLLDLYFQKRYTEFDAFKKVSILVIDELGKRELQDWQKIQLEELVSYRYNEQLPTIFITNMTQNEFKEFMGDRITDRLRENKVQTVLLTGESLRGNLNK